MQVPGAAILFFIACVPPVLLFQVALRRFLRRLRAGLARNTLTAPLVWTLIAALAFAINAGLSARALLHGSGQIVFDGPLVIAGIVSWIAFWIWLLFDLVTPRKRRRYYS